jgi:LCP family protein required for cell wall assembly
MSSSAPIPLDDERPPSLWWGMWKRFLIGGALIVVISGAATAAVALNTATGVAHDIFNRINQVAAPKGLVRPPEYEGAPATYLILGSDRRAASKDALDRTDPPHSDTILLVRFDPEQGQTSVLSIPRDLLVNIKASTGQYYPQEKVNAAYTYGAMLGGVRGSMVLAAETIEHEVFPGLKLNGIVDVNFKGFIQVVDTLGCVYVNVDHRYYHVNTGAPEENYSEINLQPGYQKLCYNNALSYVRYRHGDSDFVRVARQQDFLRDLREQISPSNVAGQLDKVAKAVGHAIITSGFSSSADQLIELAKLIGFSQSKPLRQVKFRAANANAAIKGGSYVTSTPELEQATLNDFLHGQQKVSVPQTPASASSSHGHATHGHHKQSSAPSSASIGLYPTPTAGDNELVKESVNMPFRVLYPGLETGPAVQQPARAYTLLDNDNHLRHAYIVAFQQNTLGGYYDFEGTDWLNPPIVAHPSETRRIGHTDYRIFADGSHIHLVAWRQGNVLYWVVNTLLEDLTNEQMLAIARSAQPLH